MIYDDISEVLLSEDEIKKIVERLGKQISRDYAGKNLLLVSILKGSVVFMADLMRAITVPCQINFMVVSSYGNKTENTTGAVKIEQDLDVNLEGFDVLLVEDILDSGRTLNYVKNVLLTRNPSSIRICAFLDKPDRRVVDLKADYWGTDVPDEFVVGYGLDYAEKYRNLPFIGVLKREIYEEKEKMN